MQRSPRSPARALPLALLLGSWLLGPLTGCAQRADTFRAPPLSPCAEGEAPLGPLRVASYNIRAGLSSSLEDIARDLEALDADVVALQEVDRESERSGGIDQAAWLGERLGMDRVYAAAREEPGGDFGVALLSRLPLSEAERIELEGGVFSLEPRVAVLGAVCTKGGPVRIVGVHADILPWASEAQARALSVRIHEHVGEGVVLAGDLNATPEWSAPRILTTLGLVDVFTRFGAPPTFTGDPFGRRIDYLLLDAPLAAAATDARVLESRASDHLPLFVDLDLDRRAELASR